MNDRRRQLIQKSAQYGGQGPVVQYEFSHELGTIKHDLFALLADSTYMHISSGR